MTVHEILYAVAALLGIVVGPAIVELIKHRV